MSKYRELFETDEWEWFLRLGKAKSDPEEKKAFFDGVIERKLADPAYSLFTDFPKESENEEGLSEKAKISRKYAGEILEMLRRGKGNEVEQ